jgi:hypothetical protein
LAEGGQGQKGGSTKSREKFFSCNGNVTTLVSTLVLVFSKRRIQAILKKVVKIIVKLIWKGI